MFAYSDAAVRGAWYVDSAGTQARSLEGLAVGAWVAWVGTDTTKRPVVSGMGFLSSHAGPQQAEYMALIRGLSESLMFVEGCEVAARPAALVVHTDNECVANTLLGVSGVYQLKELRTVARGLQDRVEHLGVEVHYELVPRTNQQLKRAHVMSQAAFKQLLLPEWQPDGKTTARRVLLSSATARPISLSPPKEMIWHGNRK